MKPPGLLSAHLHPPIFFTTHPFDNILSTRTAPPLLAPLKLVTSSSFPVSPPRRPSRVSLTIRSMIQNTETNTQQNAADVLFDSSASPPGEYSVQTVTSPTVLTTLPPPKLSLSDQAFFLLAFIACTTSVAFTSFVVAAVPTLTAMGRAATSFSKLADTAREELPSTMAAIRLSGMEISDLTLELNDLSQEISDGVSKSAQAVQAAEAGIRQIGTLARQQTMSMIQERASLPVISLQPVVAGAAKKTSRAVNQATKTIINYISGGDHDAEGEGGNSVDSSGI